MEVIKQFDRILLKDGREASVTEIFGDQDMFAIDTGSSPKDWDWDTVKRDDIERILF